jgi:PHD/YefM family antitoxin component YafN of YafNO toxin-antitoxin module
MAATTLSLQEFHENVQAAEEAAQRGPVLIADSSGPRTVLLSIDDYRHLQQRATTLAEAFSHAHLSEQAADFEFPQSSFLFHPADLS